MKKVWLFGLVAGLGLQSSVFAGTFVTLKAVSVPRYSSNYYSGGPWVSIDAIATAPIDCGGTTTTMLRFFTTYAESSDATGNAQGAGNMSFIAISEIIDAAKHAYPIDIAINALVFNNDVCEIRKHFIYYE